MNVKKWLLILIILVASAIRLYHLQVQPLKLLFSEVEYIWSRNLFSVLSLSSPGTTQELPLCNFIFFIGDWLIFVAGYFFGYFKLTLDFDSKRLTDLSMFILSGRLIAVFFAVATIYIVYLIGKKIKDQETGLVSALFFSTMYLHIEHSRYINSIVFVVFLTTIEFLFILNILRGNLKFYLLSGFVIGFAGAVKYSCFIMIGPFFLAHILRFNNWKESFNRINAKKISLGAIFVVIGFIFGYPLIFKEFSLFLENLKYHYYVLKGGWLPDKFPQNNCWVGYLAVIYNGAGINLIILSIGGMFYSLVKKQKDTILMVSFFTVFFVFLVSLNKLTPYYALPLFPFLALLAAYFLVNMAYFLSPMKLRGLFLVVISLILIFPAAAKLRKADFYTCLKNREELINEFVLEHLPEDVRFLDSHRKLISRLPILVKANEKYYRPRINLVMDNYLGSLVQISGKVYFSSYKGEVIKITVGSIKQHYNEYEHPDIAILTSQPGGYEIKVPKNCGRIIMKVKVWGVDGALLKEKLFGKDVVLDIKDKDIKDVDFIID
jgi:asparagine N-glycosylation enzyme membrane subunit Stt3